jgi:hypothetical protein
MKYCTAKIELTHIHYYVIFCLLSPIFLPEHQGVQITQCFAADTIYDCISNLLSLQKF